MNAYQKKAFNIRKIIGMSCVLFGLLFNVWILGRILASDHQVSSFFLRLAIYSVQLFVIGSGMLILLRSEYAPIKLCSRFARRFPYTTILLLCILGVVLVWMGMEICLYGAERLWMRNHSARYEGGYPDELFSPDPVLGARLEANRCVQSRLLLDEQPIFDVTYCTDALGRRVTPVDSETNRDSHALFLGGSFTFGEGVNDAETLPAQIAKRMPAIRPYNYGVPGRDPGYALTILRNRNLCNEISEEKGFAFFTFIDYHMERIMGSMRVAGGWGANLPCYALQDEQIVRLGSFESVYPWRCRIYNMLNKDRVLQFAKIDIPFVRRKKHYRFAARLLQALKEEYQRQFPGNDFFVLLYPSADRKQRIRPFLEEIGITCLEPPEEVLPSPKDRFLEKNKHPVPAMHSSIAQYCADILKRQWSAHP